MHVPLRCSQWTDAKGLPVAEIDLNGLGTQEVMRIESDDTPTVRGVVDTTSSICNLVLDHGRTLSFSHRGAYFCVETSFGASVTIYAGKPIGPKRTTLLPRQDEDNQTSAWEHLTEHRDCILALSVALLTIAAIAGLRK